MRRFRNSKFAKSFLVAVLAGALTLGNASSPAIAGVLLSPGTTETHTYSVGDNVNLDLGCQPTDNFSTVDSNWYDSGTLPDGLIYNNGLVTGTPTAPGTYSLTGFGCNWTYNNDFHFSASNSSFTATFVILPPSSPSPSLWVTPLNNRNCDFRVMGMTPGQTEAGAATLTFTKDGSTWGPVILNDPSAGAVFDFTVSALDLTSMTAYQQVSSVPGPSGTWCDSETTLTFSYNTVGHMQASAAVTFTPSRTEDLASTPSALWTSSPTIDCGLHLNVVFPSVAPNAKPFLSLSLDVFDYEIFLDNPQPGVIYSYEFPVMNPSAMSQVDGVDSVTYSGTGPECGSVWFAELSLQDGLGEFTITENWQANQHLDSGPDECAAGSYSLTGKAPCTLAGPGQFVSGVGATAQTPCPLGSFSSLSGATECTIAPRGTYVATLGATSAKPCPAGYSTWISGARYARECYKLLLQTARGVMVSAKQKFGAKIVTSATTDRGKPLNLVATGSCAAKKITQTVKVNGKSVKASRWQITTSSKAGTCKLTFSNPGDQTYAPFTKVISVKVSKTGK